MTRLQAGERAYQAKKWVEAIDQLRIACFGLLDQPQYLSEGLAVLALAQNGAGKQAAVDTTLGRFVEVEQRFGAWAKVPLSRDVRAEFETLLTKRVRPEVLLTVPSLSGLVETEEQRIAKLPPKERLKALEAKAAAEPRNVVWPLELARAAAERGDDKGTIRWADRVLEVDDKQIEALTLRARARLARGDRAGSLADLKALPPARFAADSALYADLFVCLAETGDLEGARAALGNVPGELRSRRDVAAASRRLPPEKTEKTEKAEKAERRPAEPPVVPVAETRPSPPESPGKVLAEAREMIKAGKPAEAKGLLVPLAKSDPKNRDVNKQLLEAALLTKDWKLCAALAASLEPFADTEGPSMFYAAVGLYETGNLEGARTLLARARPLIASAPFVDYYSKRILGN